MKLIDFLRRLAVGELKNLAMAANWADTIDDAALPEIVTYLNDGLEKLHERFQLRIRDIFLEQVGHRTLYPIESQYAKFGRADQSTPWFLRDTAAEPFKDDIIKILEVWDGFGRKLPLNDPDSWGSLYTPQPMVLQIPHPMDGRPLSIQYQATHPELTHKRLTAEIELPRFLMKALRSYVSSEVFTHMNTQEMQAVGAEHLKKFESICVETELNDLVTTGVTNSGVRFINNGWV
jgi:hypothetical protein